MILECFNMFLILSLLKVFFNFLKHLKVINTVLCGKLCASCSEELIHESWVKRDNFTQNFQENMASQESGQVDVCFGDTFLTWCYL